MTAKQFEGWVAIYGPHIEGAWSVSPKDVWDARGYIPDTHIAITIPGFDEIQEHTLRRSDWYENDLADEYDPSDDREALEALGFEIIDNPVWGWARSI